MHLDMDAQVIDFIGTLIIVIVLGIIILASWGEKK